MAFVAIASAVSTAVGTYMSIQGQKHSAKVAQVQADAEQMTAKWNADQAMKQAKFEEDTAQANMRRTRLNNRRAIARQRATGARSGLSETGAVADMLVDASDRLQQDVDDIWRNASIRSSQLQGEAQMSIWQGENAMERGKQAKAASKYAIYGTIAKGVAGTASSLSSLGGGSNAPTPNPNQTTPLKAVPYNGG